MKSSRRCASASLLRAPLWTLQITEILLRPVTGFPPTVLAQDATSQQHCVDKVGDVADGNGVVAAAVNVDATLLPGQTRRIPRGRPHGGGGCSHRLRAQVLGGAVIKFLLNPCNKEKPSASMNGRRTRQRDGGRLMLISSQRQTQYNSPPKRQLQVWVRHQAAGRYRPPLRNRS